MKNYQVSLVKDENGESALRQAMELLGGMESVVDKGDRVLIKPNNVIQEYVPGTVSSAEILAAVTLLVYEAGGKPIIGENNLVYDPSLPNFETSCGKHYHDALADINLEKKVPIIDLMKDDMIDVELPGAKIFKSTKIARTALEVDKLIDLPVLKTHDQTQVTLGIKNLKGVLPLKEKKRSHELGVEQCIVDLCLYLKPALIVVDGLTAAEGMGPIGGTPFKMDLVIVGTNALSTDLVGASVMGFELAKINYLNYAIEDGMGPCNLEDIEILGESLDAVKRKFITAQDVVIEQYKEMGIEVICNQVCSGCWAEFRHIYYGLREERSKLKGTTCVLGHVKKLPNLDKAIIIGKCARGVASHGIYVPGCPPHHKKIEEAARKCMEKVCTPNKTIK